MRPPPGDDPFAWVAYENRWPEFLCPVHMARFYGVKRSPFRDVSPS
jgi:hypothetical protein